MPVSTPVTWFTYAMIFLFIGGLIYTIVTIGYATANSDNKTQMTTAIGSVTIVNSILILVLGGTAYFYIQAEPDALRPYVIVMLHLSLLLSVTSISVSTLLKLQ